jgi:hypothetical protein
MRKKLLWAVLLCLVLAAVMPMTALAADVAVGSADVSALLAAIDAAADGDTIVIPAGTYEVGTELRLNKAVSLKGAGVDQTTIVGSINYYCPDYEGTISVSNLTVKSPAGNTTSQQAIWWSYNTASPLDGANLVVENCKIVDYLFGIGVNSSTKNCTLTVTNLTLDNVWCGANVSEGAGNTIASFGVADGSDVVYAVQVFGGSVANGYYKTDADRVAGNAPALTDNTKMPDIRNGNWPAVAEVDGCYYGKLADAVNAAAGAADKTVTLTDDAAIDSMLSLNTEGLVLDLAGHMIIASENFPYDENNANNSHLVQILADNIQIKNGSLVATANNKHTLNVWGADGVVLENLTLDHTNGKTGAPPMALRSR